MRAFNFIQIVTAPLLTGILAVGFTTDLRAEALSLQKPAEVPAKGFPSDEVGMSAYVKVDQTVDIEGIVSNKIFKIVEDVGENYILGIVPINDFGGNIDVHLYAHTQGWLVAYFRRDEVAARVMQWYPASIYNPVISTISRTTLSDALHEAADAGGVLNLPKINYYHFGYPDATDMALLVKGVGGAGGGGTRIMQVKFPEDYMIYETSWFHVLSGVNRDSYGKVSSTSILRVDETEISRLNFDCGHEVSRTDRDFGTYGEAVGIGTLHTIELYFSFYGGYGSSTGGSGIATVLIYRAQ